MTRYWSAILFLVVLVTPFALRAAMKKSDVVVTDSNSLRLIIVSPHTEGIRREFADAFSAWHKEKFGQSVVVDYRNYGGASDIVKYFQTAKPAVFDKLGTYNIDLAWGGGDYLFDRQLKPIGCLEPVKLDDAVMKAAFPKPDINGVALFEITKTGESSWFGTALSSFGIIYNKDVLKHLGLPEPKTWRDLQDPLYRGWVVMADPTRSASAKTSFMTIVERSMADAVEQKRSEDAGWAEGMGLIRQISSNARMFTDSASMVPNVVGAGDAAAGMAIDFYARAQVEAVGSERLGYVEPANATILNPDPIAVVKGAPNLEVAKRFVEFVLSERGQRLWITKAGAPGGPKSTSLRRLPIMRSVYDSPRDFTENVDPYKAAGSFNTSNSRKKTFGILGELIEMSCMEPLPELRETRKVVLDSPKAAELNARLGLFPFDQKEALARADRWAKGTPVEQLEMHRQWMREFAQEYETLQREAKQR